MMKQLLLILSFIFLSSSYIQAKKLYVEMEFYNNSIKLDDGSNKKHQPIKGEDGKDLKFTSLIGALNYMSLHGWELIDIKSITEGASKPIFGSTSINVKTYYIFAKEIPDSELEEIVSNSFKK